MTCHYCNNTGAVVGEICPCPYGTALRRHIDSDPRLKAIDDRINSLGNGVNGEEFDHVIADLEQALACLGNVNNPYLN